MRFVIKPAKRGLRRRRQVMVEVVADNNRTLLWSESYDNIADAATMIEQVKAQAQFAPVVYLTGSR